MNTRCMLKVIEYDCKSILLPQSHRKFQCFCGIPYLIKVMVPFLVIFLFEAVIISM